MVNRDSGESDRRASGEGSGANIGSGDAQQHRESGPTTTENSNVHHGRVARVMMWCGGPVASCDVTGRALEEALLPHVNTRISTFEFRSGLVQLDEMCFLHRHQKPVILGLLLP